MSKHECDEFKTCMCDVNNALIAIFAGFILGVIGLCLLYVYCPEVYL